MIIPPHPNPLPQGRGNQILFSTTIYRLPNILVSAARCMLYDYPRFFVVRLRQTPQNDKKYSILQSSAVSRLPSTEFFMPALRCPLHVPLCSFPSTEYIQFHTRILHPCNPYPMRCLVEGGIKWNKKMPGPRIELGTPGFSVPCSTN